MSIFEPTPRGARADDETQEFDDAAWANLAPPRGFLDPRSIRIAGLVVSGIVAVGLVASNTAEPEPRPRAAVASRVDPGAAAVEQTEAQPVPTADPSAPASADPVDATDDTYSADGGLQLPEGSGDDRWSGKPKGDDKPGRGRGHGRD